MQGAIKRMLLFKMESSIKSLTITGMAAEDAMKPRRSGGSRKKRNLSEDDNNDKNAEENEFIENAKNIIFKKQSDPRIITHVHPQVQAPLPVHIKNTHAAAHAVAEPPPQQNQIEGGTVILKPPKHQRVKLQPKALAHAVPTQNGSQTRKARRIHLTVANLTHRFTRAKRVRDDTDKKSHDMIREYLIKKGVIQAKSRAPEKMLRSMYSDFMLLKDPAL
jgi:hypothetical protein